MCTDRPPTVCTSRFPSPQLVCSRHGDRRRYSSRAGRQKRLERHRDRPSPVPGVAARRDVFVLHGHQVLGRELALPGTNGGAPTVSKRAATKRLEEYRPEWHSVWVYTSSCLGMVHWRRSGHYRAATKTSELPVTFSMVR